MIRRFVNIVAEDCRSGVYSLHRIDVSNHLFYPSTAGAQAANAAADGTTMETLPELPAPCARIQPAPTPQASSSNTDMAFFGLLSPRRILCVDTAGHALAIDAGDGAHSTIIAPTLTCGKGRWPILISAAASPADHHRTTTSSSCCKVEEEEDLYVMARSHRREAAWWGSCFDVLRAGTWQWEPLPPPPLVFDDDGYNTYNPTTVWSHAVVDGGRAICVSFLEGFGTYCFDTAERTWRRAGDWELPFRLCQTHSCTAKS